MRERERKERKNGWFGGFPRPARRFGVATDVVRANGTGKNPPVPVVATVGYVGLVRITYLDLVQADGTGRPIRTDVR